MKTDCEQCEYIKRAFSIPYCDVKNTLNLDAEGCALFKDRKTCENPSAFEEALSREIDRYNDELP